MSRDEIVPGEVTLVESGSSWCVSFYVAADPVYRSVEALGSPRTAPTVRFIVAVDKLPIEQTLWRP